MSGQRICDMYLSRFYFFTLAALSVALMFSSPSTQTVAGDLKVISFTDKRINPGYSLSGKNLPTDGEIDSKIIGGLELEDPKRSSDLGDGKDVPFAYPNLLPFP
jgi:hypothetical protein